jgi:hypothetical protein
MGQPIDKASIIFSLRGPVPYQGLDNIIKCLGHSVTKAYIIFLFMGQSLRRASILFSHEWATPLQRITEYFLTMGQHLPMPFNNISHGHGLGPYTGVLNICCNVGYSLLNLHVIFSHIWARPLQGQK